MGNYMSIQEYYLEHSGIGGMKWGHRNGPPYPLNPQKDYSKREKRFAGLLGKKKKKPVEKKLTKSEKKKIIDNGDLESARKRVKEFSNEELDQIFKKYDNKIKLDRKLSDIDKEEFTHKMNTANDYISTIAKVGENVVKVTSTGISIYNHAAALNNAFSDSKWKTINTNFNINNNNNNNRK